jgi:nonsense-mediated mRNA decay protein 3
MTYLPCPVCGIPSKNQINGRCRDCFLKTITLAQIPHVIHGVICPMCGSVKKGARWIEDDNGIEEKIKDVIEQALNYHQDARDIQVSIKLTSSNPSISRGHIQVTAAIEGIKAQTALETEVRVSRETCDICSRKAGGYYEAVIQIRAEGRFPDEEEQTQVLELMEEIVDRQHHRGDRMAFISDIEILHEGTDVYIGSNATARQICRSAAERFGSKYSESPTLVGRRDGQDIYRVTYSLRLPRFIPGDIINVGGCAVLIRTSGKRTSGLYLESGLEFSENTERLKDPEKIGDVNDAISAVLISVEKDTVQVLHPVTFRPVTIKKPAHLSNSGGKEIRIVIFNDNMFILPPE